MDLALVNPPAENVLELAEAKAHLRIDLDDQDDLIGDLIDAATAWLDGYSGVLGRCLIEQTWVARYDYGFPGWRIPLPLSPLVGVDLVQYVDASGVTQTISADDYQVLDGAACAIQPAYGKAWPAPRSQPRSVLITFRAGYGGPDDIPRPLRAAIKLMVGHLYANREAAVGIDQRGNATPLPLGVADLIAPFKARSAA